MTKNVTVLTDENGVRREYSEVKRKASVGERIKIVDSTDSRWNNGDIFTVNHMSVSGVFIPHKYGASISYPGHAQVFDAEYSVLGPTSTVIVDGVRYREEKRKAAVGERVLYVWEKEPAQVFTATAVRANGDVEVDDEYGDDTCGIDFGAYRVLTPIDERVTPASAQEPKTITVTIPAIHVTVNGNTDEAVRMTSEQVGAAIRKAIAKITQSKPKSPQEIRDEIVERAKTDVAELLDENYPDLLVWFTKKDRYCISDKVDFVINHEKRTVVAIIRQIGNNAVLYRGIAKCAPGDVFNSHIGRAIALRRALGLEVPTEYMNAPQPTEVRIGDVITETDGCLKPGVVTAIRPSGYASADKGLTIKLADGGTWWTYIAWARITDDSREEVSV